MKRKFVKLSVVFSLFVGLMFLAGIAADVNADGKLATTWGSVKKGERGLRAAPPRDIVNINEHTILIICRLHTGPTDHPPNCGAEDDVYKPIGFWGGASNTYRIVSYPTYTGSGTSQESINIAIDAAFEQLAKAENPDNVLISGLPPKFSYDGGSPNTIGWRPMSRWTIAQVTLTKDKTDKKKIISFKMEFNDMYKWFTATGETDCFLMSAKEAKELDIQDVATHEVGHIYGLGHSSNPAGIGLTMYYAILEYGELLKRSLGTGDAIVLDGIY